MMNKLFAFLVISLFVTTAVGGDELCETEGAGGVTKSYRMQADSCMKGKKVKSYSVMDLVRDEAEIEKLRALLENDCIEGFRNSIGRTIADDWAEKSKVDSLCSDSSGFFRSWLCYFLEKIVELDEEFFEKQEKAEKLRKALKILVDSEWFTEDMRNRIGLTEFDVALIKDDSERVVAMLDAIPNMKDNNPAKNAELLRFMTLSSSVLQHLVRSHENYSKHLSSSHIKDPSLETVVMITGPGGETWSYAEFNHAINIIEQLGLNWILVGDGVHGYSLETLELLIEPLISGLEGKLVFWIHGHGLVDEEVGGHTIEFHKIKATKTRELLERLKAICGNKAIDVILDSCYSGAAYTDAIEVLLEGSRFLSSAAVDDDSTASGKLLLNGVDHFMKFHDKFNSVFELFSLGYLYKTIDIEKGSQIFASVSNVGPFVLKLNRASIDFEYVFENKEKIVKYLEHYIDGETLELAGAFIDSRGMSLKEDSAIKVGNLSRMVQYAVGMIRRGGDVLKEGGEEFIAANEDDCEKILIREKYLKCMLQKIDGLRKRNQKLDERIEAIDG